MTSAPPGLSAPAHAPAPHAGENVYQAVAAWARRAPRGRLNAWTVGGVVDAVGILLFLQVIWPLACAFLCLAAVGGWGLAAQKLQELEAGQTTPLRRGALREVMFAAVVVGTLSAILAFFGVFLMILGPSWKL